MSDLEYNAQVDDKELEVMSKAYIVPQQDCLSIHERTQKLPQKPATLANQ